MATPDDHRPELRSFQTWMQTFIVSPGSPQEALQKAEEAAGFPIGSAGRLVKASPTLSEMERLMIYRRMFPLRMEEALSIDFPVCKTLLGGKAFSALVTEYVQAYPSHSWTLDHLGAHLAGFLRSHPLLEAYPGLADLAHLEWTLCEIYNAEDSTTLSPEAMLEVDPQAWPEARFICIPALEILRLSSNSNDLYRAYNQGLDLPAHESGDRCLLVWRAQNEIWRMPITEPACHLLLALREGKTLGEALDSTLNLHHLEEEQLFEWFQSWVGEGLFRAVHTPEDPFVPTPPHSHPTYQGVPL